MKLRFWRKEETAPRELDERDAREILLHAYGYLRRRSYSAAEDILLEAYRDVEDAQMAKFRKDRW